MSMHDEEVLGKAYDARLMRRLLRYLWPYRLQVAVALASIICASVLQLAQPYLMKIGTSQPGTSRASIGSRSRSSRSCWARSRWSISRRGCCR